MIIFALRKTILPPLPYSHRGRYSIGTLWIMEDDDGRHDYYKISQEVYEENFLLDISRR